MSRDIMVWRHLSNSNLTFQTNIIFVSARFTKVGHDNFLVSFMSNVNLKTNLILVNFRCVRDRRQFLLNVLQLHLFFAFFAFPEHNFGIKLKPNVKIVRLKQCGLTLVRSAC